MGKLHQVLHSTQGRKLRGVELAVGVVLCTLAGAAFYAMMTHRGIPSAIPYLASSDKHAAPKPAATNTPTAPTSNASSDAGETIPVVVRPVVAATDPNGITAAALPPSNSLVSASISTPILQTGPIQISDPLPTTKLLCKVPITINTPILSLDTKQC